MSCAKSIPVRINYIHILSKSLKIRPTSQLMHLCEKTSLLKAYPRSLTVSTLKLELYLEDDLKIINADPAQIEQILFALAVNAKDAMPDGGRITIATESVILDREFCRAHAEAKPGEYVVLTVSDTGHGIGQETLVRVFDPFYSKKDLVDSPGLGLSVVYGVAKNHDGFVLCFSESDQGTTFKVYFPATDREAKLATRIEVEI